MTTPKPGTIRRNAARNAKWSYTKTSGIIQIAHVFWPAGDSSTRTLCGRRHLLRGLVLRDAPDEMVRCKMCENVIESVKTLDTAPEPWYNESS